MNRRQLDPNVEYAVCVDKNDRILAYHPRGETMHKKSIFRICAVFIENYKGEVLIQKRSLTKDFGPGLWENAAGGMVNQESYLSSAYRELFEEIGVPKKAINLKRVHKNILDNNNGHARMICWFYGTLDWDIEQFTIDQTEVEKIMWIDKKTLYSEVQKNPNSYMPSALYWSKLFPTN